MNGNQKQKEPESQYVGLRIPAQLKEQVFRRCKAMDLTFSQLVRRALRRELGDDEAEKTTPNS